MRVQYFVIKIWLPAPQTQKAWGMKMVLDFYNQYLHIYAFYNNATFMPYYLQPTSVRVAYLAGLWTIPVYQLLTSGFICCVLCHLV